MTSQWTGIVRGVTDGATALLVVLPTFTTSMGQTTILPLNPNSLTITLSLNIQLTVPPATAITLSGLKGTATPSSAVLPITQNIGSAITAQGQTTAGIDANLAAALTNTAGNASNAYVTQQTIGALNGQSGLTPGYGTGATGTTPLSYVTPAS